MTAMVSIWRRNRGLEWLRLARAATVALHEFATAEIRRRSTAKLKIPTTHFLPLTHQSVLSAGFTANQKLELS
jgi:hypothetical protein